MDRLDRAIEYYKWIVTEVERKELQNSIEEQGVINMSEDQTKQDRNEDVSEAVDVEKYRDLLRRDLTEDEVSFLQEIEDKRQAQQREMSEPQIIRELNQTAKTRKDSDRRSVGQLKDIASGQTRNGGK